jgi:hypothetical protein
VADRVVDRRTRPIIDTAKLGEETEPGGIHRSAGRPGGDAGNDRCLGRHDERPWHGYEAPLIRVRHLLANHIEFRRSQDATDTDSHGQMAASHLSATCWIAC